VTDQANTNSRGPGHEPEPEQLRALLAMAASPEEDRPPEFRADEADPALLHAVSRQRRVASLLQSGGPELPPTLNARLDSLHERRQRSSVLRLPSPRLRWAGASVAAAAAAAIVAVVLATSGSSKALPATQVASVWTRPATSTGVSVNPTNSAALDVVFHGTSYPNYHDSEGWHPVGTRSDRIGGAAAFTVYYATGQRRAAYTVVAGKRVAIPSTARRFTVRGVRLAEFRDGDRWVVVFPDHGNSCVLTAAAPREKQWLVKLAVWHRGPTATPI
jgi:hypothetical protein